MAMLVASPLIGNHCMKRATSLRQQKKLDGPTPGRRHCNRPVTVSASIGFSTDPRLQIERAAADLLKDVAALLVYQEVFRSPPAQAFLKLLLVLRRRDDDLKILEAYAEFYRLMASARHPSWEDFLLERILIAEGNPFAEAVAGIGNTGGEVPCSLEAAAIADLDTLQRLSINESTLITWVKELVSDTRAEWRNAASSNLSSRSVPKVTSSTDEKPRVFGFMLNEDAGKETNEDKKPVPTSETSVIENEKPPVKESDFVTSDRERWQKKIGGLWKWSEAVPSLKQYYNEFGFGRAAISQVVKWRVGKFVPDFKYLIDMKGPDLSVWKEQISELKRTLTHRFIQQAVPRHVLVHGPAGSGKSWLLRSVLRKASEESRFRIVILPSTEMKQLFTILEDLKKNSNVRFVLLIEDLFSRAVEETYNLLKSGMDENLQEWPCNVLLCATSRRHEAKVGDSSTNLGDIFGVTVALNELDEQQYIKCVEEIMEFKLNTAQIKEDIRRNAIEWGQQAGFNVQNAAEFVEDVMLE